MGRTACTVLQCLYKGALDPFYQYCGAIGLGAGRFEKVWLDCRYCQEFKPAPTLTQNNIQRVLEVLCLRLKRPECDWTIRHYVEPMIGMRDIKLPLSHFHSWHEQRQNLPLIY